MAETGRIVSIPKTTPGVGRRPDAPLGPVSNISKFILADPGRRKDSGFLRARKLTNPMCGICGQYNFGEPTPVVPAVIERMTRTMVHRGPDDEGFYFSGPIGLGFRRLSIIDIEGGHQPMSDLEQSVWIAFNGEIYNFNQLRDELERYGHVFQTRCDTEVIIHGYKQWGEDVFNHLNGMFGVAIWDVNRKKLVIARDPMGIKLVYYSLDGGTLSFGSEIRAVRAASPGNVDIDPVALNLFLRYRYTPSPLTLHKGIKKLAPGTMLVVENGEYRLSRWYKYRPEPLDSRTSEQEAREELLRLYRNAIKRHLISDVPVGLLLSGGVDSGLILGLMKEFGDSWPTYTVGYGADFADDELVDAARTASILSVPNYPIQLDQDTFEEALPKIVSFLEEPIASSSIVPMYFVCERARRDVKVALIGQGPDELFGGYTRHLGIRYGEYWRKCPGWIKKSLNSLIDFMPRNEALKRGSYSLDVQDRMKRYQAAFSILSGANIDSLFVDGLLPENPGDRILECWSDFEELMSHTDELGGFQFVELRSSLPDELLMYSDKLSMAHGLEVRVPYLDREVVEFAERLPARMKIRNGSTKWLHRQLCRSYLPRGNHPEKETRIRSKRRRQVVRERTSTGKCSPCWGTTGR